MSPTDGVHLIMKKLPPYGRQLFVSPQTRILMLYINAPQCWQAAKDDRSSGQFNNLVLPDIGDAGLYRWPVEDRVITGIDFGSSAQPEIENLISALAKAGATEVALRQMYNDQITVYLRDEKESVA